MSDTRTVKLPEALRNLLDRYRRRWRALGSARSLFATLGVLATSIGVAVLADRLLRLSAGIRTVLLVAIAAAFSVCLMRALARYVIRKVSDRRAAVDLGESFPAAGEDLLSAVELGAAADAEEGVSRSLVASALRKIAQRATGVDYRVAAPMRPVLKVAAVLGVVAAVLLAAYLLRPEGMTNALVRLFKPGSDVPYYSYTDLRVSPGDGVVAIGSSVDIELILSGAVPEEARLDGRTGEDSIRVVLPCESGRASWQSGPLFEDLSYRVRAGDALAGWHTIRVMPPPALTRRSAVLTLPKYTGVEEQIIAEIQGALEIVAGTSVVLRAEPVARGSDPRLTCEGELTLGEQRFSLQRGESGVLVSPAFTPCKSIEGAIGLKDGFGLRSRSPDTVFIKVKPDGLPRIRITKPGRDLVLLEGEKIVVETSAEDEFGLRGLSLLYRVVRRDRGRERALAWKKRRLEEGGPKTQQLEGSTELDVNAMQLRAGDVLEYKAEASDFADEHHMRCAYSEACRITVMSRMEHMEMVLKKLQDLRLQLMLRAHEQRSQAKLADKLGKAAAEKSVGEEAEAAERQEREHARKTEAVARRLEDLIAEAGRNPSASMNMLGELERLARGVRSTARGPMGDAAQSFKKAADGDQAGQPGELSEAGKSCEAAARRLDDLARLAERLQRRSILEILAAHAEMLAARQSELRAATIPVALKTSGADRKDLDEVLNRLLDSLVVMQDFIREGVEMLEGDIERAARRLAFTNPAEAVTADEALKVLRAEGVAERAAALTKWMEQNVLFAKLPEQDKVEHSLLKAAKVLRGTLESETVEGIERTLDEFIRRQMEIITHIEAAVAEKPDALRPAALGDEESVLDRDVSEEASALRWLALEVELFESATAAKLDAAAEEMGLASEQLYRASLLEGLRHAAKALNLLREAKEKFQAEREKMAAACQACRSLRGLLLLQQILMGQKRVNKETAEADEKRAKEKDVFAVTVVRLAKDQGDLRLKANQLIALLREAAGVAAVVGKAGEKMDVSRLALEAGDTGRDTRVVQREVVALLEKLLKEQSQNAGGMGLAGARMLAMLQMMQQVGMSPGGFAGGTNAPILPATLKEAEDEEWRAVRSRFEEELGASSDVEYPAQFRALLEAYFDRLRQAPPE